jgi:hypothetical protein
MVVAFGEAWVLEMNLLKDLGEGCFFDSTSFNCSLRLNVFG